MIEFAARTFLGVEYPGLVMIEQQLYEDGNGLAITVAHEVVHQWWYSQVGNNVQTAAWLDEALASYSQIVYQEGVNGPDAAVRKQIGEAAFDRFLHTHYSQHRYDYVGGADLLADAEGACSCDLHPLYAD